MEEIREKSNVLQCHPELDSGSRGKYMRFRVPPVGGQAWHGMTARRIPPPALPAGRQVADGNVNARAWGNNITALFCG